MTGLNCKQKVVGREQDSGETERERDREAECCCKLGMASVIKLAVVENSYDGYRRLVLDHQDGHYDYFLRLKYSLLFAVDFSPDRQVAKMAQLSFTVITFFTILIFCQ